MLDRSRTNFAVSREMNVSVTASAIADGCALVGVLEAGFIAVKPSTGTAGEVYQGCPIMERQVPTSLADYVLLTVPSVAPYTVTLPNLPIGTAMVVKNVTTGANYTVQVGAPTAQGQVQFTGTQTLTFFSADAGAQISVTYRYSPTVAQVRYFFGDANPGATTAEFAVNRVSVIKIGLIYTSEFDTSVDWTAPTSIVAGASGRYTIGGTGAVVNATVAALPTNDLPYLGLQINCA